MNSNLLAIGLLQFFAIVVGLLKGKALALLLGPAQFGVMSTVDQVVLMLISLGSLSLPFTATKFMSRSHSISAARFEATSASFLRVLAILSVSTTAIGLVLLAVNPRLFGGDLIRYRMIIQLAMLGIPSAMLHVLVVNTFAAAQRPLAAAGVSLCLAGLLAAAAVSGVRVQGLVGLYAVTTSVGFLALAGSLSYLRHSVGVQILGPHTDVFEELRQSPEVISHAACIYVAQATIAMAMLVSRYVVLSRLGEASAGLLQSSLSISLTVGAVLAPMSAYYLMPLVNRQMLQTEKIDAANAFAAQMLIFLFLGALPVVLFPQVLIRLLYTGAFTGAAATLFVFVLWQCIFQIANIYQQVLIGLDDVRFMSIAATVGFGLAAGLMYILVPIVGLSGVGVGLAVGMLLYGVAAGLRLRNRHGLGVPTRVTLRALLLGVTVLIAGVLFRNDSGLSTSGLSLRVGYATVVSYILWLSLQPGEREYVTSTPARLQALWRSGGKGNRSD